MAGIASALIAVVFGIAQCGPSSDPKRVSDATTSTPTLPPPTSEPARPETPADDLLELVEMEYGQEAAEVEVTGMLEPGAPTADPPEPDTKPVKVRPLVLTLRNTGDNPLVLTGLKVVVHEVLMVPACATEGGGGVAPTLNYEFRFPVPPTSEWSATGPQNFAVEPRSVDALSVTIGPAASGDAVYVWRYSVHAVVKDGREILWGGGVGTDGFEVSVDDYLAYTVYGQDSGASPAAIRACADEVVETVQGYIDQSTAPAFAVQSEVEHLIEAYQRLASK
ncbi:hypothetical protein Ais01nite_03920 [Asanoa ishikariensis]|uniref:Uncharacterized protein n=1 Tax=Asanoa ishikariensis TaxID=137265 RepID=A0A1H3TJD4_9ACTN|nr:hypothetical protein [Asanoa ishikariensis]GIF62357.1 hypothetical protein Ais01nite_03920 [Asanoa ishikariensis]SDZ50097.1 hypothetical protein SAMN05421684_5839 [Asanoa ishikariensis]